jgi:hypothetical protein
METEGKAKAIFGFRGQTNGDASDDDSDYD